MADPTIPFDPYLTPDNPEGAPVAPNITPDNPESTAPPPDASASPTKEISADDTVQGYGNAESAAVNQDGVTVDEYLVQIGQTASQLPDFVTQMRQTYPNAKKTPLQWTNALETFLGRKIA